MTGVGIQREPKGGIESETSPSSLQAAVQGMADEERRRDEDGGSLPANVFALRYVVAGLISRIPGKGACEREEGKEEPRLPDAKGGRDCTATFCPTKEGILSVYCWTKRIVLFSSSRLFCSFFRPGCLGKCRLRDNFGNSV